MRFRPLAVLSILSLQLAICPPAGAEDLSAESLSSLSSIGSSTLDVLDDASSLSSVRDLSSTSLAGAPGDRAGQLVDTKRVAGSEGRRIRYTSTNEAGELIPVTGAFYKVRRPKGLVALAPGTRGLGDQCAPSAGHSMVSSIGRDRTINVNYEAPMVRMLNDAGYSVVVTDYIGLGTEGLHTYLNRIDQGHALIDAARATATPNQKVAFWGYSQGGGAAAAAAELVDEYAPELNVVATFAGAPPADPLATLEQGNPWLLQAVAGFAAASYYETYPEYRDALDEYLTPAGHAWLDGLKTSCIIDAAGAQPAGPLFKSGLTHAQIARDDERIRKYLDHNKLGLHPVSTPILVLTNKDDDIVPEPQATQLAADYCALGSPVEYRRVVIPGSPTQPLSSGASKQSSVLTARAPSSGHGAPLVLQTGNVIEWLDERMAGTPMKQVCPADYPDYQVVEGLNAVEVAAVVVATLAALGVLAAAAAPFVQQYLPGPLGPFSAP